ncbi:APC family permease [Weissella hellenica]|uniref:Amino acid permease n=1 Tax=Weissella hellenica TaxID=46256 RepID=A0A4Y4G2S0_WEIHE|nr:amino acid permease [Weissella hellenica]NKY66725.1 amino acid permease [Weissella hellenica]GED36013.1 serine/threonine exchanger SteT [Weissella hellenica]SCB86957.1 basic amino acid/polyamine antiporter, APA family [Weissella hellenica]
MAQDVELKRSMGIWSGLSLVVGTVIGSGIFFKQAGVLQTAGSSTLGLLAWLAGGIITLAAGLTIAEIGARLPKTGGLYSYIESLYGPVAGFLTGWMQVVIYAPAVIASIAGYAAFLTANFLGVSTKYATWISVLYVVFIAAVNLFENRVAAGFQVLTTSIKLIPIAILIIYGLFFGKVDALGQTVTHTVTHGGGFGMAILATLFAYDGWILLANIAGELKNPRRDLPRSLVGGVSIIVVAYVGVSFGVYHALPSDKIVALQNNATFAVVRAAFGDLGGRALSIAIIISMLGTLNGKMMSFPRMAYAMSLDGLFPKYLSKLTRKTQEPTNAILTVAGMTIALAIIYTNGVDRLSDIAIFTIWIFYTAAFIGVFILRHKKTDATLDEKTLFKTPLFPITPLVAIFGALFVIFSTIINDFTGAVISLLLVAVGLPVFYYYNHRRQH